MTIEGWVGIITAIAGGLGTGVGIAAWLVKREVARVMAAVDRVPEKQWFERIEAKIDHLDPDRLLEHYRRVDQHGTQLLDHEGRLDHVERQGADHEARIRYVEGKRG
jgi:hypothetical protein